MKDRKDWGPADELANTQMVASGVFFVILVALAIFGWFAGYWFFG